MSKYIDLSRRITPDLPTHPYDSPLSLIRDKTLERDGYVNTRLEGGMHSGTHLDVPMHLIRDGRYTADWDLNRFSGHPLVTEELADFFIDRKIGLLGMDLSSPDAYPFPVHKKLFARDIPILENLTNLESLLGRDDFEILAFPLKIEAEGSPVRAVARIKDDL
ncbi:MAG: cyclase family protein [Spirochaetales bacterium]|nr:cyclase family protein [Spirochaetales bacterium]